MRSFQFGDIPLVREQLADPSIPTSVLIGGQFLNFTGKISATTGDAPTLLPETSLSLAFQNVTIPSEDFGNVGGWDTSNVQDMSRMFSRANDFNQDIGGWDTGKVQDMNGMFSRANDFNQDIGNWNTSNVTDMSSMFEDAIAFNQDLRGWCVTNIPIEPTDFSTDPPLADANKPAWGTCPPLNHK